MHTSLSWHPPLLLRRVARRSRIEFPSDGARQARLRVAFARTDQQTGESAVLPREDQNFIMTGETGDSLAAITVLLRIKAQPFAWIGLIQELSNLPGHRCGQQRGALIAREARKIRRRADKIMTLLRTDGEETPQDNRGDQAASARTTSPLTNNPSAPADTFTVSPSAITPSISIAASGFCR